MVSKKPGNSGLRKGRHSIAGQIYQITTVTYQRTPIFTSLPIARTFIRCLHLPENLDNSQWLAWVLMPDHFHGLLQLGNEDNLSEVIRKIKGRSAHEINQKRQQKERVWQEAYHDHALRKEEDIKSVARYMIANPLRAKIVDNIGEYPFWDAVWL